jgi:histone H3/H4
MSKSAGTTFPLATLVKLLKSSGIERTSRDSLIKFDEILTNYSAKISSRTKDALAIAKRKTATVDDVIFAARD